MTYPTISEELTEPDLINTNCYICKAPITIKRPPRLCTTCRTNLAYIARNYKSPERKINNLKLRLVALSSIKRNPNLGTTEALRQAIKHVNSLTAKQGKN